MLCYYLIVWELDMSLDRPLVLSFTSELLAAILVITIDHPLVNRLATHDLYQPLNDQDRPSHCQLNTAHTLFQQ